VQFCTSESSTGTSTDYYIGTSTVNSYSIGDTSKSGSSSRSSSKIISVAGWSKASPDRCTSASYESEHATSVLGRNRIDVPRRTDRELHRSDDGHSSRTAAAAATTTAAAATAAAATTAATTAAATTAAAAAAAAAASPELPGRCTERTLSVSRAPLGTRVTDTFAGENLDKKQPHHDLRPLRGDGDGLLED